MTREERLQTRLNEARELTKRLAGEAEDCENLVLPRELQQALDDTEAEIRAENEAADKDFENMEALGEEDKKLHSQIKAAKIRIADLSAHLHTNAEKRKALTISFGSHRKAASKICADSLTSGPYMKAKEAKKDMGARARLLRKKSREAYQKSLQIAGRLAAEQRRNAGKRGTDTENLGKAKAKKSDLPVRGQGLL